MNLCTLLFKYKLHSNTIQYSSKPKNVHLLVLQHLNQQRYLSGISSVKKCHFVVGTDEQEKLEHKKRDVILSLAACSSSSNFSIVYQHSTHTHKLGSFVNLIILVMSINTFFDNDNFLLKFKKKFATEFAACTAQNRIQGHAENEQYFWIRLWHIID